MTESEIITRIIFLESQIIEKVIGDKTFKACDNDQFSEHRKELKVLREKVKHIIYPKSCLPDGKDPQRPD